MENEATVIIPILFFAATFIGGIGKVLVGWLNARSEGQKFDKFKFFSTVVTTFFASIIVYGGVETSEIGFSQSSIFGAIIFFLGLGFFGADQMKNFILGGFNKMMK